MGASRLLSDELRQAKADIRARYLAGESVPSIARDHGISERGVYYHLGRLTADDKGLHTKNQALRRQAEMQHTPEERKEEHANPESEKPKAKSSLSDFIE